MDLFFRIFKDSIQLFAYLVLLLGFSFPQSRIRLLIHLIFTSSLYKHLGPMSASVNTSTFKLVPYPSCPCNEKHQDSLDILFDCSCLNDLRCVFKITPETPIFSYSFPKFAGIVIERRAIFAVSKQTSPSPSSTTLSQKHIFSFSYPKSDLPQSKYRHLHHYLHVLYHFIFCFVFIFKFISVVENLFHYN